MYELLKMWLRKPDKLWLSFLVLLPIIASQILQRLYPIIDNRYLAMLGEQALYIHNVQYNFITFGQFVGFATYISCLVFWRRKECSGQQGNILIKHLLLAGLFTSSFAILSWIFSSTILEYYKVDSTYLPIAKTYLKMGLCSMVLQALYGGLDGMLVGSQQQHSSMYIATLLVMMNIIIDRYAAHMLFSGIYNVESIKVPLLIIGFSNVILLLIGIVFALILVIKRANGWKLFLFKEMLPVWWGELGSYLVRGIAPFFYAYQLCFVKAAAGFFVTYQLAFHLSYIFCFPLIAAMQVAVRDASQSTNEVNTNNMIPKWWNTFLYTGLIPTTILLALGAACSVQMIKIIYGYVTPTDHIPFLALFFIGCWIGQWGNMFTIPLRVAKKSYLVTKNFFFAELIAMLGGTQLLIYMNIATPAALGYVTLFFTFVYGFSNLRDAYFISKKHQMRLVYESNN